MSATNFTPIQLYRTSTAAAVPTAGNLAAGELAINLTDERLYFKNAAGVVKLLASNSGALGTVTSVDVSGGTTGLTTSGGPITSSGTITLAGTLGVANGGTGTATAFTAGSVVFAGASGVYSQDNANLFWDNANDRLGIGTASPSEKLTAYNGTSRTLIRTASDLNFAGAYLGTATSSNRGASLELLTHVDGSNSAGWRTAVSIDLFGGTGDLVFSFAGNSSTYAGLSYSEKMRLDINGNLGIGVVPSAWSAIRPVQTGLAASFSGGSAFNDAFVASNAYYDGTNWRYINTNTAYYNSIGGSAAARWYTAASGTAGAVTSFTQAMTLDAGGRLGIGTAAASLASKVVIEGTNANVASQIQIVGTGVLSGYIGPSADGLNFGADGGGLLFRTGVTGNASVTTGTERMRINSSGNVNIGTTATDVSALAISRNSSTASVAASSSIVLSNRNTGINGTIAGGIFVDTYRDIADPHYSGGIWFTRNQASANLSSSTDIIFGATGSVTSSALPTERMRLDAEGNLGVSATPSAWGSNFKAIQMQNGTSLSSHPTVPVTYLNSNSYFDGTNSRYITTGFASSFITSGYEGGFVWQTAPTGTAGNVATYTTRMVLTDTGNVGIGTSSPNYRLVVGGASGSTTTPTAMRMDDTYASSPAWDRLKFYLFKNATESYGLGLGVEADMQYWAGPANDGMHKFFTRQTERLRIDNLGLVSTGTTATTAQLTVSGAGGSGQVAGFRNCLYLRNSNSSGNQSSFLVFGSAGTVSSCYIGNDIQGDGTTIDRLDVQAGGSGGVYLASGGTSWTSTSDERGKDIIEPISDAAQKVSTLRAVIGKYKTDAEGTRRSFLIAQDVQAVLPEAVNVGTDDQQTLGVAYTDTIPLLVAAIKELTARVAQLEGN